MALGSPIQKILFDHRDSGRTTSSRVSSARVYHFGQRRSHSHLLAVPYTSGDCVYHWIKRLLFALEKKIQPNRDYGGMLELAEGGKKFSVPTEDPEVATFIKEVSQIPEITEDDAAKLVAAHIKSKEPKNYGYYRVSAIRNIGGSHKLKPNMDPRLNMIYDELSDVGFSTSGASAILAGTKGAVKPAIVEFASTKCAVLESEKLVKIGVQRTGNLTGTATINYETIDGTATAESDYITKKDVMVFKPGETLKHIDITIIDDNEWEENEVFFVMLSPYDIKNPTVTVGKQSITEVTIINDDEPGILSFQKPSYVVKESIGKAKFMVERTQGTDGTIKVTYKTKDQSAISGKDFIAGDGVLVFEHGEQIKHIDIEIIDDKAFQKDENFLLELSDPTGGAQLGKIKRTIATIVNDDEYKRLFDRVVSLTHLNLDRLKLGSSSWRMQFREAMSVNGGDVENATTMDYIMHFLTFAWKIIFAFCPPCSYGGGWFTFAVALGMIGLLTAVVGDIATIFGCLIGLRKEVTAITFVAMGTSLPDLFASKTAAVSEKYADASIGNVTGSNSVNVFLGLGTPWVIAAIYHKVKTGGPFKVDSGTLIVSVVTYCVCAVLCLTVLVLRRYIKVLGGAELGGPRKMKYITGAFLISLWVVYIVISSLVSYEIIKF
ncbi:hypothetical protein QZH41_008456 [Actinostola sp. cb2023]|nr:hypothetical protein QZH41_008456 [Actinostola sp. cb2023]